MNTKEQVIEKVRQILKDEKFRLDAYFFCGFPAGEPNQKLVKACEGYLDAVDNEKPQQELAAALIAALEETVAKTPKIADVDNLMNNMGDIEAVLEKKELLLA